MIALGLPSYGPVYREPVLCLSALMHAHPEWRQFPVTDCPNADIARAIVAELALGQGADCILWIDSDISFPLELPQLIVQLASDTNGVVGAVYSEKNEQHSVPRITGVMPPGMSLIPAERVGFGLCAVPRSAFARMPIAKVMAMGRWVSPWFTSDLSWGELVSDDYAFCRRACGANVPIHALVTDTLRHWGPKGYSLEGRIGVHNG